MNIKSNSFLWSLPSIVYRAKEHDEYMDAEVIPDSDQLSSMYPVFVATVIIAVATARGTSREVSIVDLEYGRCFPCKSLTRETFTLFCFIYLYI